MQFYGEKEIERLGSTPNTAQAIGICSQRPGLGSVDEVTKKRHQEQGLCASQSNKILAKLGQGDQTPSGDGGEEPAQILRVISYQEIFLQLDFTRKCTGGLKRSLRHWTEVWLTKECFVTISPLTQKTVEKEIEIENGGESERERMRREFLRDRCQGFKKGLIDLQGLTDICARKMWKTLLLLPRDCGGGCAYLVAKKNSALGGASLLPKCWIRTRSSLCGLSGYRRAATLPGGRD